MKTNLATFINREDGKRVNDALQNNKNNEMAIFRNIFKVTYNNNDINKFVNEKESLNEATDKNLLLKVFKNISKNRATSSILNKNDTINFNILKAKFSDEEEQTEKSVNRQSLGNQIANANLNSNDYPINKVVLSDGESDGDLEINNNVDEKTDAPNATAPKRKSVITPNPDVIDKKLDNYLGDLYAKKRVSQIPFRRISTGYYDYGNQKVMVKLEGETIRVRTGGGYILLDKFIEVNAPIEEAMKMNLQNVNKKYKDNTGMQKVISPNKPVYSLSGNSLNNPKNQMSIEKGLNYKVHK